MTNALRDQNYVTTKMAVLNTDSVQGTNLVNIAIDDATGEIQINTSASISFTMEPVAPKDENYVNVWLFEGTNGRTYPAVADSNGHLLVDN